MSSPLISSLSPLRRSREDEGVLAMPFSQSASLYYPEMNPLFVQPLERRATLLSDPSDLRLLQRGIEEHYPLPDRNMPPVQCTTAEQLRLYFLILCRHLSMNQREEFRIRLSPRTQMLFSTQIQEKIETVYQSVTGKRIQSSHQCQEEDSSLIFLIYAQGYHLGDRRCLVVPEVFIRQIFLRFWAISCFFELFNVSQVRVVRKNTKSPENHQKPLAKQYFRPNYLSLDYPILSLRLL